MANSRASRQGTRIRLEAELLPANVVPDKPVPSPVELKKELFRGFNRVADSETDLCILAVCVVWGSSNTCRNIGNNIRLSNSWIVLTLLSDSDDGS